MKVVISNVNSLLLSAIVVTAPLMADAERIPAAKGQYEPTWESLSQRKTPDWFRDAKFGIWAHWGPQCQPEAGDWYARGMYEQGGYAYSHHLENYGHPTEEGFMEIMNEWKALAWDPDKLMELYKKTGARYFMAMGNPYTSEDIRFTTKDGYLYAHIMEWPEDDRVLIKSIKDTGIKSVKLLGGKSLSYRSTPDGLLVTLPKSKRPNDISATLKIKLL